MNYLEEIYSILIDIYKELKNKINVNYINDRLRKLKELLHANKHINKHIMNKSEIDMLLYYIYEINYTFNAIVKKRKLFGGDTFSMKLDDGLIGDNIDKIINTDGVFNIELFDDYGYKVKLSRNFFHEDDIRVINSWIFNLKEILNYDVNIKNIDANKTIINNKIYEVMNSLHDYYDLNMKIIITEKSKY